MAASILVAVFGSTYGDYSKSFYFVTFLLPVAMATSYFFNYYIVPQFLLKKKYTRFTLYTIYTLIISFYLEMVVITISFIVLANYNYGELDPMMTNIFVLGFTIYLVVLLKAFYLLYRRFRENEFRLEQLKDEKEALKTTFITVRADRSNHQIKLNELMYLESLSDYVKIYFNDQSLITRDTISSFEESLPETFVRIHRSYIVNLDFITEFSSKSVTLGNTELPISRTYKDTALRYISG
ncbi:LytTR family DNA-binding domain-containing protein [Rhodohalobacter sp.]|uniref:LytR/AlgR family response regulator transcription factor n=1 Tax=Rhodohalobacter sp. TaxID=1974210 RepID=UPI002ACDCDFC|nr:LytTR family DNA-binding domain-containing protein [Rhodohalobacter sp.]MDZ7755018.1 LytTR family DNA-binding domain-containing protein [Rhodohalobacter sp.]